MGGHRGCLSGVALSLASPQGQYRTVLYDSWVKQLTTHHVPHTSEPTLIGTLGNPVKIRSWQVPTPGGWSNWAGPAVWSGWARSLPPPSHPLSWVCLEMRLLSPPGASQRLVGRRGESRASGTDAGQRGQGVLMRVGVGWESSVQSEGYEVVSELDPGGQVELAQGENQEAQAGAEREHSPGGLMGFTGSVKMV